MTITLNPNLNINFRSSANENGFLPTKERRVNVFPTQPFPEKKEEKSTLKKIYSGWIKLSTMTKGVIKGILSGAFLGGIIALVDIVYSGSKKVTKGNLKIKDMLNPKASMSKTGKIAAPVVAGLVFIEKIVVAKLKSNKKLS